MASATIRIGLDEANALCEAAAMALGASQAVARALALSVTKAEAEGQASVGLSHFIDYLDALESGRLDGRAEASISRPAPAMILSDANGGAAQPGFDSVFDDLVQTAKTFGISLFSQKNAFTCGALGSFVARIADAGLIGIAATNGPPLLAGSGSRTPVFCTNPMAFAAPVAGAPHLVIDQASSATAYVNVRAAAEAGEKLPDGWALDAAGEPTNDPVAAMKGALLAFGGARGANIALMVEVLAAGVSGANWSLDAPSFTTGNSCPATGLLVIALTPQLIDRNFTERLRRQIDRLGVLGVHIPGRSKAAMVERARENGLKVDRAVLERIEATARSRRGTGGKLELI